MNAHTVVQCFDVLQGIDVLCDIAAAVTAARRRQSRTARRAHQPIVLSRVKGCFPRVAAVQIHGGRTIFARHAARRGFQCQFKVARAAEILCAHGDIQGQMAHAEGEHQLGVHLGVVPPCLSRSIACGDDFRADHGVHRAASFHRDSNVLAVRIIDRVGEADHGRLLLLVVQDREGAGAGGGIGGRTAGRAEDDIEHPVAVAGLVVLGDDFQILLGLARNKGQLHRRADNNIGHHVGDGLQVFEYIALGCQTLAGCVLTGKEIHRLPQRIGSLVCIPADGNRFAVLNGGDCSLVPVGHSLDIRVDVIFAAGGGLAGLSLRIFDGFLSLERVSSLAVELLQSFRIGISLAVFILQPARFVQEFKSCLGTLPVSRLRLRIIFQHFGKLLFGAEGALFKVRTLHHLHEGEVPIRILHLCPLATDADDVILAVLRGHIRNLDKGSGFGFGISAASNLQKVDEVAVFPHFSRCRCEIEYVVIEDIGPDFDLGKIYRCLLHSECLRRHHADQHREGQSCAQKSFQGLLHVFLPPWSGLG